MISHVSKSYDYIFLGTGCAALSILMRMIDSGKFAGDKILLVDKAAKNTNDRTWCFWEKNEGYFESIVYKKWNNLQFKSAGKICVNLQIAPYQYKMIRGIDFYKYCYSQINRHPDIHVESTTISFDQQNGVLLNGLHFDAGNAVVFNSIYQPQRNPEKFYLLQHFKGWMIETAAGHFNPEKGTLMDFSISQDFGTAFVYVLPVSTNRALVEYTLFTKDLLEKEIYDIQLTQYIRQHLGITDFTITEREFGIIPMTNNRFSPFEHGRYNIGTAGGQTKASSGYTFQFIQKHAALIVQTIIDKRHPPKKASHKKRFDFYDSTLLHILANDKLSGREVFTRLFQKNPASSIFKFLDNDTTLAEELKIIATLPKKEFTIAGIKEVFKMF